MPPKAGAGGLGIERHVGAHEIEQDIEAKLPRAGETSSIAATPSEPKGGKRAADDADGGNDVLQSVRIPNENCR